MSIESKQKMYSRKSDATRAARRNLGAEAKEGVRYKITDHTNMFSYGPEFAWSAIVATTYKAPCAPKGFLSKMLGTVSRDTMEIASDVVGMGSYKQHRAVMEMSGVALNIAR